MNRRPAVLIALVFIPMLLTACGQKPERPTKRPYTPPPEPSAEQMKRAQGIMAIVNRLRARHGVKPLVLEAHLMLAAKRHAQEMVRTFRFYHTARDGSLPEDRVGRTGYRWINVGENLAAGAASYDDAVRLWRSSPCHNFAMLSPAYTQAGVAYAYSPSGRRNPPYHHWWVLVMARPSAFMIFFRKYPTAGVDAKVRPGDPINPPLPAGCRIRR